MEPGAFLLFPFPSPSLTRTFSSNLAFLPPRSCWATLPCSFSVGDVSGKGRAPHKVLLPAPLKSRDGRAAAPAPTPPPLPVPHRFHRGRLGTLLPALTPCPAGPRQLVTEKDPSPGRPSFVDNKLGFSQGGSEPPQPSRSPSIFSRFSRNGSGLCRPAPLRPGSLRRVRAFSALHRSLR